VGIALIVGNGLFFDLLRQSGVSISDWHPSNPTLWTNPALVAGGDTVLSQLPRFDRFISQWRQNEQLSDFAIFDRIVRGAAPNIDFYADRNEPIPERYRRKLTAVEARHFLVVSLGHAQVNLVDTLNLQAWRWCQWLEKHRNRLRAITSFNYDLILESALREAGVEYRRSALEQERRGVPIHKPHGSIDFVMRQNLIAGVEPEYPLRNLIFANNAPQQRVENLVAPRLDAEIVLPAEASDIGHYQWVRVGVQEWRNNVANATDLVLVGLSYWRCDEEELDKLVDAVPRNCNVHICNPSPSIVWIQKLMNRFGRSNVHCISDGPPDI